MNNRRPAAASLLQHLEHLQSQQLAVPRVEHDARARGEKRARSACRPPRAAAAAQGGTLAGDSVERTSWRRAVVEPSRMQSPGGCALLVEAGRVDALRQVGVQSAAMRALPPSAPKLHADQVGWGEKVEESGGSKAARAPCCGHVGPLPDPLQSAYREHSQRLTALPLRPVSVPLDVTGARLHYLCTLCSRH
jgi:hypothetical protein